MAKIDNLGRLVIPKEYRKKLGIELGDDIDMSLSDGKVIIEPIKNSCCICGVALEAGAEVPLCDGCISSITKARNG